MKRGFIRRNPRQTQNVDPHREDVITQRVYCTTCHEVTEHTVRVGDYVDTLICDGCGGKSKGAK